MISVEKDNNTLVPEDMIENRIFLIRGQKVMLSLDLADLYGIEPRVLIQAVRRNIERFPEDFMFVMTKEESANLKSQFVISSWGGARYPPYAFSEHKIGQHDQDIISLFNSINTIIGYEEKPKGKMGFI